jgi:hypothetical protein
MLLLIIETKTKGNYMTSLNLIHSPADYLTTKYHTLNTLDLTSQFNRVGFNIANEGKSTLRIPVNPELTRLFNTYTQEKQLELINQYNTKMTRYNQRLGHEKHFIRFQSNELKSTRKDHDLYLRVSNSYDGTSSLKVSLDILRLVCLNGMVAPRNIFEFSVSHRSKNIYNDAIEASYKILAKKEIIDNQIEAMTSKVLNTDEKLQLVDNMLKFRFDDREIIMAESQKLNLLRPVRQAEMNDNLYQNFNTIQEKLTKGARIALLDENGNPFHSTVRAVRSQVTADNFNDQAWQFATSLVG